MTNLTIHGYGYDKANGLLPEKGIELQMLEEKWQQNGQYWELCLGSFFMKLPSCKATARSLDIACWSSHGWPEADLKRQGVILRNKKWFDQDIQVFHPPCALVIPTSEKAETAGCSYERLLVSFGETTAEINGKKQKCRRLLLQWKQDRSVGWKMSSYKCLCFWPGRRVQTKRFMQETAM